MAQNQEGNSQKKGECPQNIERCQNIEENLLEKRRYLENIRQNLDENLQNMDENVRKLREKSASLKKSQKREEEFQEIDQSRQEIGKIMEGICQNVEINENLKKKSYKTTKQLRHQSGKK
ncbi:UNVERIFIED_CONTAM: hypothetical protein RMT77_008964 [Armadillidium vulgare]